MLSNSSFRDLLEKKDDENAKGKSRPESKADKREQQAKAKAAYEKRMELQKRREERLAEQSRYRDRAEERRKELTKELRARGENGTALGASLQGEVPEADDVAGVMGPLPGEEEAQLPQGPTFAQLGAKNREELDEQSHRLTIAQSKYLGGDIEHTHLVKGLDFALLQKRRAELTTAEKAELEAKAKRERELEEKGGKAHAKSKPDARTAWKTGADKTAAAKSAAEPAVKHTKVQVGSELARGVLQALGGPPSRPNRALASGRLVYVFETGEDSTADIPNSLVRAEDDLGVKRRDDKLLSAAIPSALGSRLNKVMTYVSRSSSDRSRAKRKERPAAPSAVTMKPLRLEPSRAPRTSEADPAPPHAPSAAAAAPPPRSSKVDLDAVAAAAAAAAAASAAAPVSGKGAVQKPPPPPRPKDDVDDIFGDGTSSDYVCKPNPEQAKAAERERRLKEALREEENEEGLVLEEADDDEDGGSEAASLLASALRGPKATKRANPDEAEDEAPDAKRPAASKQKTNKLAMSAIGSDSYAECFPDSFEGYNLELHGPDSDDEANIVRSTKKQEEPPAEEEGGKGKAGKGKGHNREKIAAQRETHKKDAKMDRDLVQIEKLMEERKKKRDRRDVGGSPAGGGFEDRVDQNELF